MSRTNTCSYFVEFGDRSDASRSHIFYGDLINWLVNSGYEDRRFLAVGPAFEAYEQQELNLGREVESLIRARREQRGQRQSERLAASEPVGFGYVSYLEETLDTSGQLITELKTQLGLAPVRVEHVRLHRKARGWFL